MTCVVDMHFVHSDMFIYMLYAPFFLSFIENGSGSF